MIKTFKSKGKLVDFIKKRYPEKISSVKLISAPFGLLILKEGMTLTDAMARLSPFSAKTSWEEAEYIKSISQR